MRWQKEMIEQARREDQSRKMQERQMVWRFQYADPARHVEFESEIRRRELARQKLGNSQMGKKNER